MARSISDIQRDIERSRKELTQSIDKLAGRANPQALAQDVKGQVLAKLQDPTVQAILGGVAAVIAGGVVFSIKRRRKHARDIADLKALLSQRA